MRLNTVMPVLWTKNLEESIGFYTHILGFSLIEANVEAHWAIARKMK